MTAIDVQNLSKQYDDHTVVDDLSFSIAKGECVALLGPNGAGKTTTIKMICGLIEPTAGTITIAGYPPNERRAAMRHFGVVLEGARNIYWRMTPWDNLVYFANIKGVRVTAEVKARMAHLLTTLDLWDRRRDEVRTFSRGMQQKVAIACALVADPQIVLLDEPTLGLDVQAYDAIVAFVRTLAMQDKTLLITTHNFDFIRDTAQRVLLMKHKLLFSGGTDKLAHLYGGRYEIRVQGLRPADHQHFPDWRIYQRDQQTILLGDAALYPALAQLEALGCRLLAANEVSLTPQVFLDVLEQTDR